MRKSTTKVRKFITKCINKKEGWFCWINDYSLITPDGFRELTDYVSSHSEIRDLIIVNNVEMTRPQRTWGSLPAWFRPASEYNSFNEHNHNSYFVFVTWNDGSGKWCDYNEDDLKELLESLPTKSQIMVIKGKGVYNG